MTTTRRTAAALVTAALALVLVGCGSSGAPSQPVAAPRADLVGNVRSSDPDWIVTDVDGAGTSQGEIQLNRADGAVAKVNWRKAEQYDSYVEDRSDLGPSAPASVLGDTGQAFTYSADDRTVIRRVDGAAFLEVRVEGVDAAGFQAFLDSLSFVDAQG